MFCSELGSFGALIRAKNFRDRVYARKTVEFGPNFSSTEERKEKDNPLLLPRTHTHVDQFLIAMKVARSFVACFLSNTPSRRSMNSFSSSVVGRSCAMPPSSATYWEVEQKFVIPSSGDIHAAAVLEALYQRLEQAGLTRTATTEIVDWYFDVPSADYPLIRQDCWLRHRSSSSSDKEQPRQGQWELKRGDAAGSKKSKATVYEEIAGEQALQITQEVIARFRDAHANDAAKTQQPQQHPDMGHLYEDHDIPVAPIEIPGLTPLARIATQRSSWRSTTTTTTTTTSAEAAAPNIAVDLDTTDFGHAVGEVETLVTDKSQIERARQDLQAWLQTVLGQDADDGSDDSLAKGPLPMGKLEFYLANKRPDVYKILVEAGLMASRPK